MPHDESIKNTNMNDKIQKAENVNRGYKND